MQKPVTFLATKTVKLAVSECQPPCRQDGGAGPAEGDAGGLETLEGGGGGGDETPERRQGAGFQQVWDCLGANLSFVKAGFS